MPTINYANIRKRINVEVPEGQNKGKRAGTIIYEDYKDPYYYIEKNFKRGHLFYVPKYTRFVNVSKKIVDGILTERDIPYVMALMIGFDDAGSFYVTIPLNDFKKAKVTEWDDKQYSVDWTKYPRIYPEQQILNLEK